MLLFDPYYDVENARVKERTMLKKTSISRQNNVF